MSSVGKNKLFQNMEQSISLERPYKELSNALISNIICHYQLKL